MTNSDTEIVAQLKAFNRTWRVDVDAYNKDNKDESIAAGADARIGPNKNYLDQKGKKVMALSPLEKARTTISKLSHASGAAAATATTSVSIVQHLFAALSEAVNDTETAEDRTSSASSSKELTLGTNNLTNSNSKLRQIEWHIVLTLELWSCVSQSTPNEKFHFKLLVLDALTDSIMSYRDQLQKNDKTVINKNIKFKPRKRKKNKKDSKTSVTAKSEKEKETLLFDHLVQVLSRAPFLLPINFPLSEFLIKHIFIQERNFWKRLPYVVSHIFDAFEISNPYLKPTEEVVERVPEKSPLLPSGQKDENVHSNRRRKNNVTDTTTAMKRKALKEKMETIAKNKKRQRLASLTSKKKRRGSHFHRNLDDISKLLDSKNAKTIHHSSSSRKRVAMNSRDGIEATLKERKVSENNPGTKSSQNRSHRIGLPARKKMNNQRHRKNNPNSRGHSQGKNNDEVRQGEVTQSLGGNKNTGVLPMTPRKSVRSDTSLVVGETPVPSCAGTRYEAVARETPVTRNDSATLNQIVGETPTNDNSFGARAMSSSKYPFLSPPSLPSPVKMHTDALVEENAIPLKQPLKLFGTVKLLKRTNSVGSRSKIQDRNFDSSSAVRRNDSSSSIDMARAFLRSKSL